MGGDGPQAQSEDSWRQEQQFWSEVEVKLVVSCFLFLIFSLNANIYLWVFINVAIQVLYQMRITSRRWLYLEFCLYFLTVS